MKKIFGLVFFISFQVSCMGTNTGNPGLNPNSGQAPATTTLMSTVCDRIAACFGGANSLTCIGQVTTVNSYTSTLGNVASSYSTMSSLGAAETNGIVVSNSTNLQACKTAIQQLSCSDTLVTQSYSTSNPSSYALTKLLFQASTSCQQVY